MAKVFIEETTLSEIGDAIRTKREMTGLIPVVDMASEKDIINKAGAWYSYGEERLGQGRENAKEYFEKNVEFREDIEKQVRAAFGIGDPIPVDEAEEKGKKPEKELQTEK